MGARPRCTGGGTRRSPTPTTRSAASTAACGWAVPRPGCSSTCKAPSRWPLLPSYHPSIEASRRQASPRYPPPHGSEQPTQQPQSSTVAARPIFGCSPFKERLQAPSPTVAAPITYGAGGAGCELELRQRRERRAAVRPALGRAGAQVYSSRA